MVGRIIRVMPIYQRIIKAYAQAFGTEGVHIFSDQVTARRCMDGAIVGVGRIEEAKALMMFGGQDGVFHAGFFGHTSPASRVIVYRIERMKVLFVAVGRDPIDAGIPLAFGR